jgi:hypothetical protein
MFNLAEDAEVITIQAAATVSSVAATDIINMKNYHKVSFIVTTGTVTVGGGISVRQMDSVSDTVASESRLGIDCYWEKTAAASGAHTKTAADSLSSYGGITVANGDDSKQYIFEVRGDQLDSSNNCIALSFDDSTWNAALVSVTAVCHPRYHQAQPVTALA